MSANNSTSHLSGSDDGLEPTPTQPVHRQGGGFDGHPAAKAHVARDVDGVGVGGLGEATCYIIIERKGYIKFCGICK